MPLLKRAGNVDDTLVGAPTEYQIIVPQRFHKGAVYQHINLFQQGTLSRVVEQLLERKSRVAPYIFIGTRVNGLCQFSKTLGLIHRVATGEGDIGIGVGLYDTHHLIGGHGTSAGEIPRLRVMTPRAGMATPCTIDGGTEARSVDHRVLDDIQYADHSLSNSSNWLPLSMCVTRSFSSESLPWFQRSVVPTR